MKEHIYNFIQLFYCILMALGIVGTAVHLALCAWGLAWITAAIGLLGYLNLVALDWAWDQ